MDALWMEAVHATRYDFKFNLPAFCHFLLNFVLRDGSWADTNITLEHDTDASAQDSPTNQNREFWCQMYHTDCEQHSVTTFEFSNLSYFRPENCLVCHPYAGLENLRPDAS